MNEMIIEIFEYSKDNWVILLIAAIFVMSALKAMEPHRVE